jgi:hypothetical protein
LIAAHHVPRSLTVVSSDHRVQRAARRRRSPFVDSDVWFADIARRRGQRRDAAAAPVRRESSLSPDEIAYWLREFGGETPNAVGSQDLGGDNDNPFPPGYAEDLLRE